MTWKMKITKRGKRKMDRRDFLKFSALGVLLTPLRRLLGGPMEHAKNVNIWKNDFFRQNTVKTDNISNGKIKALVDDRWGTYDIVKLPEKFMKWNLESRLNAFDSMMKGKPPLSGPHSGMIASYGVGRKDSKFTLNNAVKGFGFAPKRKYIDDKLEEMEKTKNNPMPQKIEFLKNLYKNPEILNPSIQTSLELYATPDFETHSFLNLVRNPQATIVFLDLPESYELRTIVRVVHPDDKKADPYEQKIVKWINNIHSYFHGKFSKKFIGLICYVIEVFDNSPGQKEARGQRIV